MDGFYQDEVQVAPFIETDENEAPIYGDRFRMRAHVEEHEEMIRGVDGVDRLTSHKIATPKRIGNLDRVWLVASDFLPGDDLDKDNQGRTAIKLSRARRRAGGFGRFETMIGR